MIYSLYTIVENKYNTLEIEDTIYRSMDLLCTELERDGTIDDYQIEPIDRTMLIGHTFHRCFIDSKQLRDTIALHIDCNYCWTHYELVCRFIAQPTFTTGTCADDYEMFNKLKGKQPKTISVSPLIYNYPPPPIPTFNNITVAPITLPQGCTVDLNVVCPSEKRNYAKSCSCGACKTFGDNCDKQFHSKWCDLSK